MSTFAKVATKMENDFVAYRRSWGRQRFVFIVRGEHLQQGVFGNYGLGFRKLGGKETFRTVDTTPFEDAYLFVDLDSAVVGWKPSEEDLAADDWFAARK